MRRLVLIYLCCICLLACKTDISEQAEPVDFIPNQFETLVTINALNDFLVTTSSNTFASTLFNTVHKKAATLKLLNPKHAIYIVYPHKNEDHFILLTKHDSTLVSKKLIETDSLFSKIAADVFVVSNNEALLQTIELNKKSSHLKHLIKVTDENAWASLVFKNNSKSYASLLFNVLKNSSSSGYSAIDFTFHNNHLAYNGVISTKKGDTIGTQPLINTKAQLQFSKAIAPKFTESLTSLSYTDYNDFQNSLHFNNLKQDTISFLNYTNEVSQLTFNKQNTMVFHSFNPELILEQIRENNTEIEVFRDTPIFEYKNDSIFKSRFKPYFGLTTTKAVAVYKNFILFSDKATTLKTIISNATNNNTLQNTHSFKAITNKLSNASSLFVYKNQIGLNETFKNANYNANAVQLINDGDITYVNGIFSNYKAPKANTPILEAFTTSIKNEAIIAPQLVKNHLNKGYDIAIQDVNNVLYLMSNSGQILWQKQLQGKILGTIQQIDSQKNKRLQLAFATKNTIYVIDRNGKDVGNFPKKFNDNITQPLSVFDYDNNRNYRLLVTQGKNLLMYDAHGKVVKGFKYQPSKTITSQPKHFRINSKDYIVFSTNTALKILNRRGATRVPVKATIQFSDNAIYNHLNTFTTTNSLGQLVQINTKGAVSRKNLKLTNKHRIDASSKTLVTMVDNTLNIRGKTINLDFGDYTAPKIFYLNNKIYVSTTDRQAKKVYLFDSQANPIKNFPVFGISEASLANIDNDNALELVTLSDSKSIIAYNLP